MRKAYHILIILNLFILISSRSSISHKNKIFREEKDIITHDANLRKSKHNHLSKYRRSEKEFSGNNPFLLPEASQGFERAIETDIEELNHPNYEKNVKKDAILSNNNQNNHNYSNALFNSNDDSNHEEHQKLNQSAENPSLDSKNPFDLVSQTALHYSNFITEEMRIISEMQSLQINCKDNDNCTNPSDKSTNDTSDVDDNKNNGNSSNGGENQKMKCNQWSAWGPCNDTCNNGFSTRYRDCFDVNNNKKPQHEFKSCSDSQCLYCTEWSVFSQCDKICGNGMKFQTRNCFFKNGKTITEKREEPCNYMTCLPKCDDWSEWSDCSKPCDGGVSVRKRLCNLADGTNKTFYEHQSCNNQVCESTKITNRQLKDDDESDETDPYIDAEDGCISLRYTFEEYQYNVKTIFDDSHEHNDGKYSNVVLFNGNQSCGYSGAFVGNDSYIKILDDIFGMFKDNDFSSIFWFYCIPNPITENKNQTLFHFESRDFNFGTYSLKINEDGHLVFDVEVNSKKETVKSKQAIEHQKWHQVAAIYSASKKQHSLFINGHRILTEKTVSSLPQKINAEKSSDYIPQIIGNDPSRSTPFSGIMDEINIFKCPMTKKDIYHLANNCPFKEKNGCPSPINGFCYPEHKAKEVIKNPSVTPLNFQS